MFEAFGTIDSLLPVSDFYRIMFWAFISGAGSMLLYRWISPQKRLEEIQLELSAAQKEMAEYDGEFAGMRSLLARNMKLALKRVALSVVPSIIAGAPLIMTIVCIDHMHSDAEVATKTNTQQISDTNIDVAENHDTNSDSSAITKVSFASDAEVDTGLVCDTSCSQDYLGFGPAWMRSWLCLFMVTSTVAALGAKFVLRIA